MYKTKKEMKITKKKRQTDRQTASQILQNISNFKKAYMCGAAAVIMIK